MRNKLLSAVCALLVFALAAFPAGAGNNADTVNDMQRVVDGILDWNVKQNRCADIQAWIDGPLTANAGMGSEWYVLTLCRSGEYDFSAYENALKKYIAENTVRSATARLKYALVLFALGSDDPYIGESLADSVGKQGIMSWIYGLHLMNNGVACADCTAEDAVSKLLELQLADGGWALTGANGDIDVTAMTLQSLAPYEPEDTRVRDAAGRALTFLSSRQLDHGGYASFGTENPESAAQVLVALSSLGVDCTEDERFIKNGRTVLDGILRYRLSDGSFCHKEGDPSNNTATVQAYYSVVSFLRMKEGKKPLYILGPDQPDEPDASVVPNEPNEPSASDGQDEPEDPDASDKPEEAQIPAGTDSGAPADISGPLPGAEGAEEPVPDVQASEEPLPEPEPEEPISEEPVPEETPPAAEEPLPEPEPSGPDEFEPEARNEPADDRPSGSSEFSEGDPEEKSGFFRGYKPVACLIAAGAGGVLCLVLLLLGKRHPKNFIAAGVLTLAAIGVILFTDFRSAEEYYGGNAAVKDAAVGTVTLTIRCDTVVGKSDSEYIPADGVILGVTEFEIEEGDTVYDILTEAARQYYIQMETTGRWNMVYVAGINYLYELDFGDLSGWIYHVNGFSPAVGCGEYVLSDGDRIEWLYSCDIGNDLRD